MAKQLKSVRLEEDVISQIAEYAKAQKTTESAAIASLINAGLKALDQEDEDEDTQKAKHADKEEHAAHEPEGIEADFIASLQKQVNTLEKQLDVKDGQIAALQRLTDQAQHLHAATEAKALETAEAKQEKRGFWARVFGD